MNCTHELYEMETACADGLCPLCLQARLREVVEALKAQDNEDLARPHERILRALAAAQPEGES